MRSTSSSQQSISLPRHNKWPSWKCKKWGSTLFFTCICLHKYQESTFLPILVWAKSRSDISLLTGRILQAFEMSKFISHNVYVWLDIFNSFSFVAFKYKSVPSIMFSHNFVPLIADKILKKIGEGQSIFSFLDLLSKISHFCLGMDLFLQCFIIHQVPLVKF